MQTTGWVKIHRRVLEWQWYTDVNVKNVFLHILLKTNTEPKKWRNITVQRGEHITSIVNLAEALYMSPDKIRGVTNE